MLIYSSLNENLWKRFPILKQPRYTDLIAGIEAGPYIVFGVLFNKYLADLAYGTDLEARATVSSFIEDMATAKDDGISEMLTLEILPALIRSQPMVDAYWPLLGASTRRRLRCIDPRLSAGVTLPSAD